MFRPAKPDAEEKGDLGRLFEGTKRPPAPRRGATDGVVAAGEAARCDLITNGE